MLRIDSFNCIVFIELMVLPHEMRTLQNGMLRASSGSDSGFERLDFGNASELGGSLFPDA
jgi:hypothetical protein